MTTMLGELRTALYLVAQEHHRIGALYYAALEKSSIERRTLTAERYRLSGEAYLEALAALEEHLLSVECDEEMEKELQRVRTLRHSVEVVLKHL